MKSFISRKQIRQTSDVKKIVIHHTADNIVLSGKDYNKEISFKYPLGMPYDIIINPNGKIDLSSQWVYGMDTSQYKCDVNMRNLIPTELHHYAQIGVNEIEQKEMCHVVVMGNFNKEYPTPFQINSLYQVLERLCKNLELCIISSLIYYSEIYFTASPGTYFPEKQEIIWELLLKSSLEKLCFPT